MPELSILDLLARAITPPGENRRFDTRFFLADASHAYSPHADPTGSGELVDLSWVALTEARALDLPGITRLVIDELEQRLALPVEDARRRAVPFVRWQGQGMRFDYI